MGDYLNVGVSFNQATSRNKIAFYALLFYE